MNKEEYIKYVENNEEMSRFLEMISSINATIELLIRKNIIEAEEFSKIKKRYKEQIIQESYGREKQEDLKAVKTIDEFMKLIGGNNE